MSELVRMNQSSPTRALDVDLSDLLAGLAYLSGGRDCVGFSIITIPTGIGLEETGIDSLTRILQYYTCVAREDTLFVGCAVYMDLTDTDVESRLCVLLALQQFKKWYDQSVGSGLSFYFFTAVQLAEGKANAISGLLRSCVGQQHTLVQGSKDLEQYSSPDQRTEDMRGTMPFDLDSWVQWRFKLEPFFADCTSCSKRACLRLEDLEGSGTPISANISTYTEELIKLKLDILLNEGAILLESLFKVPSDPVKLAMTQTRHYQQVQERIFEMNAMLRGLRKDLALACGFDADGRPVEPESRDVEDGKAAAAAKEVEEKQPPAEVPNPLRASMQRISDWICLKGLTFLSTNCQKPGYSKEECQANLQSFFQFRADAADDYISGGTTVTESIINNTDDTHPADLVQEATQLHSLVVTFRTSLSEWRERIEHAIEWHALSSEILAWSALCLEMLISDAMTGGCLPAEEVVEHLDTWLHDHPAPSSDQRQRLSALSFALRRHNFFSMETETVCSALSRSETQFQNERATVVEKVVLDKAAAAAAELTKATDDSTTQVQAAVQGGGADATRQAVESGESPVPAAYTASHLTSTAMTVEKRTPSPALQEKIDQLLDGQVVNQALFQISEGFTDTSHDDSSQSSFCSDSSGFFYADSTCPNTQSIEVDTASTEKVGRSALGRVSRVSIADIAATPLLHDLPISRVTPPVDSSDESSQDLDKLLIGDVPDTGATDEDPHARKLRLLMKELLTTEVKYIEDLDLCIRQFVHFVESDPSKPGLLVGKKNIIFGNIERIYEFNRSVLLPAFQALEDSPHKLGSVFSENEAGFGLYSVYFKNMPQQEELLEDCAQYFRTIQIRASDPFTLNSYLIKVFQRMTRYRQFIEGIQKHVVDPAHHEAHEELRAALWIVCFHLRHGNDLLALDRLKGFDGNPAEQGMLLRQDDFVVCVNKQFRSPKRRVFLFEEMVVVAKTQPAKSKKETEDTYHYKEGYRLGDITFSVSAAEKKFEICVKKHTKVTFQTAKEETKQDWVADIQKLLYHQAARLKERMASITSGIETPIFDRASWSQGSMRGSRLSAKALMMAPATASSYRMSYQSVGSSDVVLPSSPLSLSHMDSINPEPSSRVDRGSMLSSATLKLDESAVPDKAPAAVSKTKSFRETSL
ncbi:uncharacterized protein LOC135814394 isoform X1 [Sycon ciliatum]|uniref:uncharacterized protein LOC135814394 isoform X1 n=1 Tax=Sycon ciliatum TaxID=27933 RepID=UPI0031F62794